MMEISVLFFGQLEEVTGTHRLVISDVVDTDALDSHLKQQYPLLETAAYITAVNRQIVRNKVLLTENAEVALLPPFSGG
jgi:molybdopterin converting factor small subunit